MIRARLVLLLVARCLVAAGVLAGVLGGFGGLASAPRAEAEVPAVVQAPPPPACGPGWQASPVGPVDQNGQPCTAPPAPPCGGQGCNLPSGTPQGAAVVPPDAVSLGNGCWYTPTEKICNSPGPGSPGVVSPKDVAPDQNPSGGSGVAGLGSGFWYSPDNQTLSCSDNISSNGGGTPGSKGGCLIAYTGDKSKNGTGIGYFKSKADAQKEMQLLQSKTKGGGPAPAPAPPVPAGGAPLPPGTTAPPPAAGTPAPPPNVAPATPGGPTCSITNPFDCIQKAIVGAVNSGFDQIAHFFGKMAEDAMDWFWTVLSSATTLSIGGPNWTTPWMITGTIAAFIAMALFSVQLVMSVLKQDLGGVGRAARGMITAFIGAAMALVVTEALLGAVDQLSDGVMQLGLHTTDPTAIGKELFGAGGLAAALAVLSPAALLMVALSIAAAVIITWGSLMVRKALIIVSAVFGPVAFAGSMADVTKGWVRRWIEVTFALVFSKLVWVIVVVVGWQVLGNGLGQNGSGRGQQMTQLATGVLLLMVGGFAPWLALKFVHFSGDHLEHVASHGRMAAGAVTAGAAAPQKIKMATAKAGTMVGGGKGTRSTNGTSSTNGTKSSSTNGTAGSNGSSGSNGSGQKGPKGDTGSPGSQGERGGDGGRGTAGRSGPKGDPGPVVNTPERGGGRRWDNPQPPPRQPIRPPNSPPNRSPSPVNPRPKMPPTRGPND